ncbi:TPA: MaoC family dehydratase [Raoultella planticola]|nr:MaoC family dehydratase [Raoultella planticola]
MSYTVEQLKIGMFSNFEKTITETDVQLFAGVSGDINPIHISKLAGERSIFGSRVAHGILVSGLISAVIGMQLPGPGTIYLGQDIKFCAPVFIGDTINAQAEVIEIKKEKNIVKLATKCTNQEGKVVIEGVAIVMPPKGL